MGVQISALHVRRSGVVQASPERVWQEFTSFERLSAWFGIGHQLDVFEPELGGEVRLSVEIDGTRSSFGGRVLVFDAARELTFSNNWDEDGWPVATLVTLRLTPLFDACHVELFHHGFERLGAEAAGALEGYESGWHSRHIEALKAVVEGG